jgi:hypothetical protein
MKTSFFSNLNKPAKRKKSIIVYFQHGPIILPIFFFLFGITIMRLILFFIFLYIIVHKRQSYNSKVELLSNLKPSVCCRDYNT